MRGVFLYRARPLRFQTLIGTVKRSPSSAAAKLPEGVSNPHRYGQKEQGKLLDYSDALEMFQTLIGTVKSFVGPSRDWQNQVVSNPHRYGQKEMRPSSSARWSSAFQTLIGTVKRWDCWSRSSQPRRVFQTLIGTVKSLSGKTPEPILLPFQTLIGTVKRGYARGVEITLGPFQTLIGTVKSGGGRTRCLRTFLRFKPS